MAFPVNEKYIKIAEAELSVVFPESFRNKMIEANGGCVEVRSDQFELYPFYDTSDKKRIKRTCNSITHETSIAREKYSLPKDLVAIGSNGAGDTLVFKIEQDGKIGNSVYWLNHETKELVLAAEDFSDMSECV